MEQISNHLFESLYNAYSTPLYKFCYNFLQNKEDAKDATHNIFERFFKLSNLEHINNPKAFLLTMARNECINMQKKVKTHRTNINNVINSVKNTINSHNLFNSLSFEKILDSYLPKSEHVERDKSIITMKYKKDHEYITIAERTGLTEENIRQIISRFKKHMRNHTNLEQFLL